MFPKDTNLETYKRPKKIFNTEYLYAYCSGTDIYEKKNKYINITKNKQHSNVESDAKKEESEEMPIRLALDAMMQLYPMTKTYTTNPNG